MGVQRVSDSRPPRVVRWYGAAGCLAAASLLLPGVEIAGGRPNSYLLSAAVGAACLLLLAPVRPGEPPRPRRRMLALAWPVAAAAIVAGTLGVAAWPDSVAAFAVGVYGWSLAVATASYQRRTRPASVESAAAAREPVRT